ncbi:peptidyl-prolyl cis-trans isomerase FKBP16-4, chloroplastic isoform X2 [Brassica rapa]|uniref:peptidylprolyl isomerase n=1 Tax=Brassica campestris TaxID=3711 RepID=M4ELZ5_BRACM|nr:peptidyl-prolyl cis-trans isomerase FKBP16-4, chloroplastic isoform X2 [Brassica rapa]VDC72976.1 unnamed protein product [Brassica rapa]
MLTMKLLHPLHHSLSSSLPLPSRRRQSKPYRCSLPSPGGERVIRSETVVSPVMMSQSFEGRRVLLGCLLSAAGGILLPDSSEAVSTSRRALRASKIPDSEFTTLPNGLKYYDIKVGNGAEAVKGSRVAVHYVAKWKGITFMTSRQGLGVGGGTPYGFDVGQSENGNVLKGLDLGTEGMRVGGQRLVIVPPELAYGKKGVQEIPPNATIELDIELLSIKQSPFGTPVKIVEG